MTPEIEEQMTVIDGALKKAVATDDLLFNMLIGVHGNGKTWCARLARSSGLDFIYFSVITWSVSLEEHWSNCTNIEYPKRTGKKLVIIIDEAERLLGKRSPGSQKNKPRFWLNLDLFGYWNQWLYGIALSNRPEDLDEAFLSVAIIACCGCAGSRSSERIIKSM